MSRPPLPSPEVHEPCGVSSIDEDDEDFKAPIPEVGSP